MLPLHCTMTRNTQRWVLLQVLTPRVFIPTLHSKSFLFKLRCGQNDSFFFILFFLIPFTMVSNISLAPLGHLGPIFSGNVSAALLIPFLGCHFISLSHSILQTGGTAFPIVEIKLDFGARHTLILIPTQLLTGLMSYKIQLDCLKGE